MTIEGLFTSREIAIAVWIAVGLAFVIWHAASRAAAKRVVHAFLQPAILYIYALMVVYVGLIVWGLHRVGLWEARQLKDTVIWFLVVAATSLFRLPTSADDPVYLKEVIKDNLKLIVAIEFIVAFYTFDLWIELMIVPFSTVLLLTAAFAEREERHKPVANFLNGVATALGAFVLVYALYRLAEDFSGFAKLETIADFVLPALLSLLFLPFILVLALVTNYQLEFRLLGRAIKDDALRRYARRQAVRRFGARTSLVKRWRRQLFFADQRTREDIDRSVEEVLKRSRRERKPPVVPASKGWSPYAAKGFLAGEGLVGGFYEPTAGFGWYASATRNASERKSLSSFEYTVEGDAEAATCLRLELQTFQPNPNVADVKEFATLAVRLYEAALLQPIPDEFVECIFAREKVERRVAGRVVTVNNEAWRAGERGGFTMGLCIRTEDAHAAGERAPFA